MEGLIFSAAMAFAITSPQILIKIEKEIERKKVFMIPHKSFQSKRKVQY
jgi:hypothetical protein